MRISISKEQHNRGFGNGVAADSIKSSSSIHHASISVNAVNKNTPKTTSTTKKPYEDEDDDYDYKDELDELEDEYIHAASKHTVVKEWTNIPCEKPLEGRCHCGHQRDPNEKGRTRSVVNCTNAGFTESDFFRFVPETTEVLIVRGNHLKELPVNLFGADREMILLRKLDLSENGIESIKGKTFHHVPSVETLILNYNKIKGNVLDDHPRLLSNFYSLKSLHLTRAFQVDNWSILNGLRTIFLRSNLTKVMKIHLEQNKIQRIPDGRLFCQLKGLYDLHLGQNELTDLRLDIQDPDCLPQLRLVDLSFNKIKTVSPTSGVFELMEHFNQRGERVQVDVHENPFHCDCMMDTFQSWIHNITLLKPDSIRFRSSLRCKTGYPESNKNYILFNVPKTECAPTLTTTNEVINRLSESMLSIMLISCVAILLAIYVSKMGLPSFLRGICSHNLHNPLLSTTTGVKYTSVDKEEAAEVAHV